MKELIFALTIILLNINVNGQPAYRIAGVKFGDSLNVRSAPNIQSSIVMKLPPDATQIRKVEISANWAKIEFNGRIGWVNKQFLKSVNEPLGQNLICFGNEPYWKLGIVGNEITYKDIDKKIWVFHINLIQKSENQTNIWSIDAQDTLGNKVLLFLLLEDCSDGMSDKNYPYKLLIADEQRAKSFNGCCEENQEPPPKK